MTPGIKPLIAGNWKMNGTGVHLAELQFIADGASAYSDLLDSAICLPTTLIERAVRITAGSSLQIGAQDCHSNQSGAHTGDVSSSMLEDAGAGLVIVGHSERRSDHFETDSIVLAKGEAAYAADLTAIVCVGETKEQREAGRALEVVGTQLEGSVSSHATASNTVIAYEPVWAIGTGLVPSIHDIEVVHRFIRDTLTSRFPVEGAKMRILYGGSLKPSNAEKILAIKNVDGGLIGGASLKAEDFLAICAAVQSR